MHPEVVQIGPGSCPKCGMALEPKVISLDDKPDPEYLDMKRRFWISAVLTLPVFALAMAEMLPNFHTIVPPNISIWIQFLLATPGGFVGRIAIFRAGDRLDQKCQPEHVYADRDRHRRGVSFQPGRAVPARYFPGLDA